MIYDTDISILVQHAIMSPIYQQLPQGSIRLLTVHRRQPDGPICCSLSIHSLLNEALIPSFIALSYVWGPETPTFDIILNDEKVPIRENLYRFLLEYTSDGLLWVDALCISQKHNIERSQQVLLMGKIYEKAQTVWAWLGPGQDQSLRDSLTYLRRHTPYAIDDLSDDDDDDDYYGRHDTGHPYNSNSSRHDTRFLYRDRNNYGDRCRYDEQLRRYNDIEHHSSKIHRELDTLSRCTYWSRAWVVQEFLLAKSVLLVYGDIRVNATIISSAIRDLERTSQKCQYIHQKLQTWFDTGFSATATSCYFGDISERFGQVDYLKDISKSRIPDTRSLMRSLCTQRDNYRPLSKEPVLMWLLHNNHERECHEPRDKI